MAQVDDECRASLERDVVAKWQEFVEDRALMLEVRIVVATAGKQGAIGGGALIGPNPV